jgi:hypothetical protein
MKKIRKDKKVDMKKSSNFVDNSVERVVTLPKQIFRY